MVQVGALLVNAFETGQFGRAHRPGVAAERDDLQVVGAESRADELVQRQCRLLHRQPAVLHHHRERRVDEQRDGRLRAGLRLRDLDVVDGDLHRQLGNARARLPQHRVRQGAGDVPRLGVAELPRPGGPGELARGTRSSGLAFAVAARELLRHIAKDHLTELAHRLGRQPPLTVGSAVQEALVHQRLLELGQSARVDGGLVAELPRQHVEVDVVHLRAGVALRQLLGELLELADVGQRLRALAHPHRIVTAEPLRAIPVLAGAGGLQMAVQLVERIHQRRRAECLLRQGIQLGALVGGEAVAEPLRGGRPLGQRIEQLVDVLRILREELAVLVHEVLEVLLRVLPIRVLVQQVVQVVEHVVDALTVLVGGILQRLLHAREALIEHLATHQVLDLLVLLLRLLGAPLVLGEFLHRLGGRVRQRLQLQLVEPSVVVECAGEFLALGEHGLVEQLLDVLQCAVEVVVLQQLSPLAVRLRGQPIGALHVLHAATHQLGQRAARRAALHDVLADLLQRVAQIDRRGQRIGPAGVSRIPRNTFSHRLFRLRRTPCRCALPGRVPRGPTRGPTHARRRSARRVAR